MKFINRGRATGKTYMLISTAYVTGVPIIVTTEEHKKYVIDMAKKMMCDVDVFTANEYRTFHYERYHDKVMVDDVESLMTDTLKRYIGSEVVAATMSISMVDVEKKELLV